MEQSASYRCPICLEPINGEAYLDVCFHKFCYHCILQWSEMVSSKSKTNALSECPLCKIHYTSIIHDFNGSTFQRHYISNSLSNNRILASGTHARRLAVYQQNSECGFSEKYIRCYGNGDNSNWLHCWLRRELQALMQDEDVDLVLHHVVGTLESFRKRTRQSSTKLELPSLTQLARTNQLDCNAISAAVEPFVFNHALKFAQELTKYLASGLSIAAYDELLISSEDAPHLSIGDDDKGTEMLLDEDIDLRFDTVKEVDFSKEEVQSEDNTAQITSSPIPYGSQGCESSDHSKHSPKSAGRKVTRKSSSHSDSSSRSEHKLARTRKMEQRGSKEENTSRKRYHHGESSYCIESSRDSGRNVGKLPAEERLSDEDGSEDGTKSCETADCMQHSWENKQHDGDSVGAIKDYPLKSADDGLKANDQDVKPVGPLDVDKPIPLPESGGKSSNASISGGKSSDDEISQGKSLETQLREKALVNFRKHLDVQAKDVNPLKQELSESQSFGSSGKATKLPDASVDKENGDANGGHESEDVARQPEQEVEVGVQPSDVNFLKQELAELKNSGEATNIPGVPEMDKESKEVSGVERSSGGEKFEQKTMSVVSGGEHVEVSYKVHIPQRSAMNSRRKIQR